VPWAAVQGSFTSRLLEIRHITEVMPLAPKGREEVNRNIPLLDESVGRALWAEHCVNTISRFTSPAELKCRNPCACSTLLGVNIAEKLQT
ncbi:unnamed protein product, partial [Bubo scandiacus]